MLFFKYLIFISLAIIARTETSESDPAKCSQTIDKSAVTAEAAAAAAKALKKPPTAYNNEVYSSKVKSEYLSFYIEVN
jgi:hypothetical protein